MSIPYPSLIVTGAAGFIGSCFVAQAVERGQHVVVLDKLTYAGHRENLEWIPQQPGSWELVHGDICDASLVSALINRVQPDAILNFAAESHVDNSIADPGSFITTNIYGTYTLLEAARVYYARLEGIKKESFRYLQVSTDEIYGSLELGSVTKFSEESQVQPNSPYSASKAAGDHLVRAWHHTYGLPVLTTNCTNNYGPRQHPEKLIPNMITKALEGKPLPVYGDGLNVRDWIHVEDHCRGVYLALTKGNPGESYGFGGAAEKANIDVVKTICRQLDASRPPGQGSYQEQIAFVADRAGHDRRYAMDDSKAERELGFTRAYDFESGIRQAVEWYLANDAWRMTLLQRKAA